jgi:hypothetical protein
MHVRSYELVGIKNALQTLRQERRFFRRQHLDSAAPVDIVDVDRQLEEYEHKILLMDGAAKRVPTNKA